MVAEWEALARGGVEVVPISGNHIDIINYQNLSLAGAIICPTNPGFYLHPQSVDNLVDFMVGKVLDLLHIEHQLKTRYEDRVTRPR